jgi:hypothetical protein
VKCEKKTYLAEKPKEAGKNLAILDSYFNYDTIAVFAGHQVGP